MRIILFIGILLLYSNMLISQERDTLKTVSQKDTNINNVLLKEKDTLKKESDRIWFVDKLASTKQTPTGKDLQLLLVEPINMFTINFHTPSNLSLGFEKRIIRFLSIHTYLGLTGLGYNQLGLGMLLPDSYELRFIQNNQKTGTYFEIGTSFHYKKNYAGVSFQKMNIKIQSTLDNFVSNFVNDIELLDIQKEFFRLSQSTVDTEVTYDLIKNSIENYSNRPIYLGFYIGRSFTLFKPKYGINIALGYNKNIRSKIVRITNEYIPSIEDTFMKGQLENQVKENMKETITGADFFSIQIAFALKWGIFNRDK